MPDTHAIPRHAGGGTSGGDAASWRIACLLALGAFLGMGLAAFLVGVLPGDLSLRHELVLEEHTALHTLARWANLAGTWRFLLPACLVIFALSRAARRRWWLWAGVFLGSGGLEHAFKFLVDRPRPSGFALGFPSGHTTAAAAFAVILIYLASRARLHPSARLSIQVTAVATMLLVGWARIVLRAHWPTDVLGGLLLGTACAAAAAWWDSTHPPRHPDERLGREEAEPPSPRQSRSSEMNNRLSREEAEPPNPRQSRSSEMNNRLNREEAEPPNPRQSRSSEMNNRLSREEAQAPNQYQSHSSNMVDSR